MFHVKGHKTIDMFDRFQHLGPKRRALLDNTRARLFRDEILPNLPVHLLKKHYDSRQGRPTNELYAMMGAAILLKRHHRDLFAKIPEELRDRYLAKKPESLFAMVKPSESARTLRELGRDMLTLVDAFSGQPRVATMTSFDQLTRLFNEQCRVNEEPETGERWAEVKANKEVPSSSLQNPSDPDAGYDGHKGQGYQVQVAETYRAKPQGQQEADSPSLRLITHIEVESANQSDAGALVPYLDDVARRDITPELALADSLYGSDSNIAEAAKRGTELVAPAMPATGEITLTDFPQSDDGERYRYRAGAEATMSELDRRTGPESNTCECAA